MRQFCRLLILAALTVVQLQSASAADCSPEQLAKSAGSVIAPCSYLLKAEDGSVSGVRRAEVFLIRGLGFHRTRHWQEAADDFEAAAKIMPRTTEIWLAWADAELYLRNTRGYIEKVKRAAVLDPNNPRVLRAAGALYWYLGAQDRAIEFYTEALRADSREPFALLYRSDAYRLQRKFTEAQWDVDVLLAVPRDVVNRDPYLDHDGSIQDFHVLALINRARIFENAEQDDKAAQAYDAAVDDGRTAVALTARAQFLARSGPSPEAIKDLEEAAQKAPLDSSAQYALGLELTIGHQYDRAFVAFDRAIGAHPHFGLALKMRARMHRQFGRTDDAVKDFMAAIEADPSILSDSLPAFRYAGYWNSSDLPEYMTPELQDAIRACMIDTTCN